MIIDFHSHILPGIDDGSKNLEMSLSMLEECKKQNIDMMVATPHFYAESMSVDHYLEKREKAYQKIVESGIAMPVCLGAEVYFFYGMSRSEKLSKLCIEGTNCLLLEMPFTQWDGLILNEVISLTKKYTVIIAHLERFIGLQKDKKYLNQLLDLDVIIQLNAECFQKLRTKRFGLKMVDEFNVLLGSDAHNMTDRKPNLQEARKVIEKKYGKARLSEMDAFGKDLLKR